MVSKLRILLSVLLLVVCALALARAPRGAQEAQWVLVAGLLTLGLPLLLVVAEVDEPTSGPPASRARTWWRAALVPGSGRGLLYLVQALVLVQVAFLTAHALSPSQRPALSNDDTTQLAALCLIVFCCSAIVALLAARRPRDWRARALVVATVLPAWALAALVSAALLGPARTDTLWFLLDPDSLCHEVRADGLWTRRAFPAALVLGAASASLALLALPRAWRGLREQGIDGTFAQGRS